MIAAISEFANRFLGRGDAAITVPSFDGALKPNQALEQAEILLACDAPEDLGGGEEVAHEPDGEGAGGGEEAERGDHLDVEVVRVRLPLGI